MSNNTLSLAVSESFTLLSFEIVNITVRPNISASVLITITASNTKLYDRVVFLEGDVYTAWTTDDYLFKYIQENIESIFGV